MLHSRMLRGESFQDLVNRIEPIIFILERAKRPVFVIASNNVIKCIYGYFQGVEVSKIPRLEIPSNTLIRLVP